LLFTTSNENICNNSTDDLNPGPPLEKQQQALDFAEDFSDCKRVLIERGELFADISQRSRKRIAEVGRSFIKDGALVLTHANSHVVMDLLLRAAETKNFSVVVTEGRPECAGYLLAKKLSEHSIPVSIVLDSGVGAIMDRVDVVLVGAEGVLENGGVVNKLGTFQIALVAKAHGKPLYVAAESYKFARIFPLSQTDLPHSVQTFEPCVFNSRVYQEPPAQVVPIKKNTPFFFLTLFMHPSFFPTIISKEQDE